LRLSGPACARPPASRYSVRGAVNQLLRPVRQGGRAGLPRRARGRRDLLRAERVALDRRRARAARPRHHARHPWTALSRELLPPASPPVVLLPDAVAPAAALGRPALPRGRSGGQRAAGDATVLPGTVRRPGGVLPGGR